MRKLLRGQFCTRQVAILAISVFTLLANLCSRPALGQPPTHVLADGNSYININTNAQATVYDWVVEEPVTGLPIDHLAELSNWYQIDSPAGPLTPEISLHTLQKVSQVMTNTNADPRPDTLTVLYRDTPNHFNIRVIFNITGGAPGSGFSQLDEDIRITNTSSTDDLYIHFFEYVDLDLHGTPDDDLIQLTGPGSLAQNDRHTDADGTFEVDRYELDYFSNTRDKLMDVNSDNLSGVWPAGAGPVGRGNVTWALQFDFVGPPPGSAPGFRHRIGPLQSADIHKEGKLQMYYVPVPEPTSALLLGMATAMLSGYGTCARKQRCSRSIHALN